MPSDQTLDGDRVRCGAMMFKVWFVLQREEEDTGHWVDVATLMRLLAFKQHRRTLYRHCMGLVGIWAIQRRKVRSGLSGLGRKYEFSINPNFHAETLSHLPQRCRHCGVLFEKLSDHFIQFPTHERPY